MSSLFDSLKEGLLEAKAHDEGKIRLPSTRVVVTPPATWKAESVKSFRQELGLTQGLFAHVVGVSKKTVEAWEAAKNPVPGPVSRLLSLLSDDKEILKKKKILSIN